jgi:hypothetical protein
MSCAIVFYTRRYRAVEPRRKQTTTSAATRNKSQDSAQKGDSQNMSHSIHSLFED